MFPLFTFSQQNQKGFKSLFINNTYDTSKPYDAQLDPRAIGFIKDYVKKNEKELNRMKVWGKSYFNLYESILMQYQIPLELKYLSVIESHLQHNLVSWAGAVGPWQLMDYEAKRFGLRVGKIDDRMDYIKSTHVACKLMKELYAEFGDWLLVVAAYNGGAGRVKRAIKKSGSKDFWNLQYYLLDETRNHVKKFIATHYLFEGSTRINQINLNNQINEYSLDSTLKNYDSVTINGRYVEDILIEQIKIEKNKFYQLNPNFKSKINGGNSFVLRLPTQYMNIFKQKKYEILQLSLHQIFTNKL